LSTDLVHNLQDQVYRIMYNYLKCIYYICYRSWKYEDIYIYIYYNKENMPRLFEIVYKSNN